MSDVDNLFFDSAAEAVSKVKSFLGVEYEVHVCSECQAACEETYAYDPNRSAEHGGKAPSWQCPECGTHYVREPEASAFSMEFYNR